MKNNSRVLFVPVKKTDTDLQIVYGEVYIPNFPDTDGEFMVPEEIRKMAHRFLMSGKVNNFDTKHDNNLNGCFLVESFIARKDDPDFIEDSWVVGVYVPDTELWEQVKKGDLNGFSMEAAVCKAPTTLELEIPDNVTGGTEEAQGHTHTFKVAFDDDGNFLGGYTDTVLDHMHQIRRGTVTETELDHNHRFSFVELVS